ncbi:J domain-containing protein CG6693-like [Armigeres subalbatus]|uniref:J domain-containing protein CG6693-like n=1 Tax=Armigeres subalbatus TaxID=124917 RepID=UPI002ED07E04
MPSTSTLCVKYYGTRDFYKVFGVSKDAKESEIKKSYYKLSLKVHPDRVEKAEKAVASEKFKVLSKIYSVLSDRNKRALYDEQGTIDDDDDADSSDINWLAFWQKFFKPVSTDDIDDFEKDYKGSQQERRDLKQAYLGGKGCVDYMSQYVPYMDYENEPRIFEILRSMIASGEIPEYKAFTEESKAKRERRRKKAAKEAAASKKEVQKKGKAQKQGSLEQQIAMRQSDRERGFNSLLDCLAAKYAQGK